MGQDNYPPPVDYNQGYNQTPVYNQPPVYTGYQGQAPEYGTPVYNSPPLGYTDSSYDTPKSHHHHSDDLYGAENIYDAPPKKCGALGDCLGWNQPIDHEDVKRNLLIRKVMCIVIIQILIVGIECSIFYFVDSIRWYLVENGWWIVLIALIPEIVVLIILVIVRRRAPLNLICLFLFTITTGLVVACIVAWYEITTIIQAAVITLVMTVSVICYTLANKTKPKWILLFILITCIGILLWSFLWLIVALCGIYTYWADQVYCLLIVILYSLLLVLDTRRLLSKYADPADYIIFAVSLYMDIITIFVYLLGARK